MLPIASDHIALEGATRADCHCQNIAGLWNRLELDPFAESNVTVGDGFRRLLPLAADAEGRNPETYLDRLRHFDNRMIALVGSYSLTAPWDSNPQGIATAAATEFLLLSHLFNLPTEATSARWILVLTWLDALVRAGARSDEIAAKAVPEGAT